MSLLKNAFWALGPGGDPYRALAFDLGHVIPGGVVKHILSASFGRLSRNGADKETLNIIDDRYLNCYILSHYPAYKFLRFSQLEPYKDHRHYEEVTSLKFADHKKWSSIFLVCEVSLE